MSKWKSSGVTPPNNVMVNAVLHEGPYNDLPQQMMHPNDDGESHVSMANKIDETVTVTRWGKLYDTSLVYNRVFEAYFLLKCTDFS